MTDPYERLNDEIHSGLEYGIEVIAFDPDFKIDFSPTGVLDAVDSYGAELMEGYRDSFGKAVIVDLTGVDPATIALVTGEVDALPPGNVEIKNLSDTDDEFAPGGIVPQPSWQSPTDETEYYFPPGCKCYIKDDIDWGEHYVRPPGGCPVHHHNLSEINQLPPLDGS